MATKSPWKDLSNGTKNVSRQSVFTELSADQLAITKSPDTKLLISWKLLDVIICFNDHHEALFNALLLAINRTQGNKIPWRYKVLNVCIWYWSLFIDYHLSLNRTKDCPKIVRYLYFKNNSTPIYRTIGNDHVVGCSGAQTTTIMYLRTVCLRINLKLNNIFCCLSNFAFLSTFIIKSTNHKLVSGHLWYSLVYTPNTKPYRYDAI